MGEVFYRKLFFVLFCIICSVFFSFYVFAAVHPSYPGFSSANSGFAFNNVSSLVSVSDTAVYRVGYFSVNGSAWQSFTLTGTSYNGDANWLSGSAFRSLPVFGVGEHYIIVYSCTYNLSISSWDCHDNNKWQLIVINNTVPVSSDTVAPTILFESPTPANGATVSSSAAGIVASVSDNSNNNTSAWIDFDRSLVGYWAMDYYTSGGVYDTSSYGNYATFVGGLNYYNLIIGKRGDALNFEGADRRLKVSNLDLSNTDKLSVAFWFRFNTLAEAIVLEHSVDYNSNNAFVIDFNGISGVGKLNFGERKTGYNLVYTSKTYNDNNWHYFVGIIDRSLGGSDEIKIYVDGALDTVNSPSHRTDNNGSFSNLDLYIGGRNINSYNFAGSLDEIMIFNRVLSSQEILALYNSKANKLNATFTNLINGLHNYTVYAVDESGNLGNSGSRNFFFSGLSCTCPSDNNVCTNDLCVNNVCQHTSISGCCTSYLQCNINQSCTNNVCVNNQPEKIIKIFIIGDSTAAEYSSSQYPLTGWGMEMQPFFDNRSVIIENKAQGGASSKSYSTTARWTETYNTMSQGDYLFIQFAHNDEHDDPEGTDPYTDYQDYLQMYVNSARAKGVYPVLLTSVVRNTWSSSVPPLITDLHGDYTLAMRELAQEQNVPLIDVTEKTRVLFNSFGKQTTTYNIFLNLAPGVYLNYPDGRIDNSHFQTRGGYEIAKLISEGIKGLGSSSTTYRLVPYIKNITQPSCTTLYYSACYNGDVYWYNSCNVVEGIRYDCSSAQTCISNSCVNSSGRIFYLSPSGNDNTGDGSITKPWFTLTKAWTVISAGDTIYLRGGTYRYSSKQTLSGKNGASGNMINIFAYPGEIPNISVTTDVNYGSWPLAVILFYGDYFHWKGIEISYAVQRPDGSGGFGLWVHDSDNNIFELLNIHHNTNGMQLYGNCNGNLILNCDSHHNQDPYSVDTYGGADGISVGYSPSGTSNVMRGCRMWWNSDDGLDMWNNDGELLVDNCWAFYNGYVPDTFTLAGNGVGYKYGKSDEDHGTNILITTRNSIAYRNKYSGYHQNGAIARLAFYNNIAYLNVNQGFWLGSFDKAHVLTNNIAYANGAPAFLTDESILTTNTFIISGGNNPVYSVSDADFLSLDNSQLLRPRKADGSLPDIDFLHLAQGSDLIDKGVSVGLPYTGAAPDLGPFETK